MEAGSLISQLLDQSPASTSFPYGIRRATGMGINIDFSFSITAINIHVQALHTCAAEVSLCTWRRNLLLEVWKSIKQFSNNFLIYKLLCGYECNCPVIFPHKLCIIHNIVIHVSRFLFTLISFRSQCQCLKVK
mgnify:CR=1 FL=1